MDVNTINDINALKAMAYDAISQKENAEQNLQVINNRIAVLQQEQIKLPGPKEKAEQVKAKPNRATRRKKK